MIVLDSNVVSEALRVEPDGFVVRWLDAQSRATLFVTSIGLAEMRYGIAIMPRGKRKQRLTEQLEDGIVALFEGRILAFDERASVAFAELRSNARRNGRSIGGFDGLIAATATAHGFAVATRDVGPFRDAGLQVINPFNES